jgi:hypothetical protein
MRSVAGPVAPCAFLRSIAIRCLVPAVMFSATTWTAEEIHAKGAVYSKVSLPAQYQAPGSCQGGHFHGLCHKCRGHGSVRPYAAASNTATVLIPDPYRPCYNPTANLALAGPRGHCFPNCFTGHPCSCCRHTIRHAHKWSLSGIIAAHTVKKGDLGIDYIFWP